MRVASLNNLFCSEQQLTWSLEERAWFALALIEALARLGPVASARRALVKDLGRAGWSARQEAYFRQFRW